MNIPGFTADASLYQTSRRYQGVYAQRYGSAKQRVISQLAVDRFSGLHGVGLSRDIGGWLCRLWCGITYSACLEGCEGTPENPKGSTHCIICDENHRACLKACR
jgi:hypothetical protein